MLQRNRYTAAKPLLLSFQLGRSLSFQLGRSLSLR